MPPPELPPEIFDQIFSFLVDDAESLQACSVASKGMPLNAVVDRWLWRDVTVAIPPPPPLSGPKGNQIISPGSGVGASRLFNEIKFGIGIGQLIQVMRIEILVPSNPMIDTFKQSQGIAEVTPLIEVSPAVFVVAPLPSSSGHELSYPYSGLGPVLPNLRVLSLSVIPTSDPTSFPTHSKASVPWVSLNSSFRKAFLERLVWNSSLDPNLQSDCISEGIEELTVVGISNFPIRVLEQCSPMLKRLHLERIERFNFSKASPVFTNSSSAAKGKKAKTCTNGRSSEEMASPSVNSAKDHLQITHLKLRHCSDTLSGLSSWLTHSWPGSNNKISTLRSLQFHFDEMRDYSTLPMILEACKETLEELEVDLGDQGLFGVSHNLLPTTAKPPHLSQPSTHPTSSQPSTPHITWTQPGPTYFPPAPLPASTTAMLQMFPNAVLQPAPTGPTTIAAAIPLSSLPNLRKLKIHTSISTHSKHMITSQGAEFTMAVKYTSAMKEIGEMLQAGWASSEALKSVELRVRFRRKGGMDAPRLKDVDFGAVSRAFEHLDEFIEPEAEAGSGSDATATKRNVEGPLVTLAIHPATFSPASSSNLHLRIPFAELISDISNNKKLMDMVRAGRVVVKGKVLERIASVGSSTFGVMQGKEEERDRIWRGEVGWGHY